MRQEPCFDGGCLCGEIRYRAIANPLRGVICHCAMCRKHSGAPALAFVHFPTTSFSWLKQRPSWYRSSQYAERGFCATCGSTVGMREEALGDRVQICIGSLDQPDRVQIDDHVWTREKVSWFEVHDELPRFTGSSSAVPSDAPSP
ncbi:MAG: GFA family protein [Lysobacter sp.]